MFLSKDLCLYPTMASLLNNALRKGVYPNPEVPDQISQDRCISDRQLYTQSNGRCFLGHDRNGSLHFLGVAGKRDYPIPTLTSEPGQLIGAYPGMYYQADLPTLLGELHFSVELADGTVLTSGDDGASTWYADYFLPVTSLTAHGLTLTSVSLAPLLEPEIAAAIPGLPLPGPSGAIHSLTIRNHTQEPVPVNLQLHLNQSFLTMYQFGSQPMETYMNRCFQSEWDHNLLFLWRPDVSVMLQAQGFRQTGNPSLPSLTRCATLQPDEEMTFTCYIAISSDSADLHPALSVLYRHTPLEWINIAAAFWRSRLGRLTTDHPDPIHQKSLDFTIRSVLDNFNCYLFNEQGELIIHQQGAPSHNSGRFWGIDAEPTALSVLFALPELAAPLLLYISARNRPAYSLYPDHSTPILMAPWIIAAHYVSLTGDAELIIGCKTLRDRLIRDIVDLLSMRSECGLLSSRYSSDGHVFRRYDFGTNCKSYYLFSSVAGLLDRMEEPALAYRCRQAAGAIRKAVGEHLTADGPFGKQFTGGSNLGEHEPFYLKDGFFYYDGEDSSSCMAPLYGLVSFRDERWQNYHRFARSLFATNYDPEMDVLRWYAWGTAVDGTALISAIGGSATREQMRVHLENLFRTGTDASGSLFWWPRARNYVRGLTRCSQGQGSWVFQHMQQWLGLKLDAANHVLTVQPQGLYTQYEWKGVRLGYACFDIKLREENGRLVLHAVNRTKDKYTVRLVGRNSDEVFSNDETTEAILPPDGAVTLSLSVHTGAAPVEPDIQAVENAHYAPDAPRLGTYLYQLHTLFDQEPGITILPFVLLSGPKPLKDARLNVHVPISFMIQSKIPGMINRIVDMNQTVEIPLGDIGANTRIAIPCYLALPRKYQHSTVWMTEAPFSVLKNSDIPCQMMIRSDEARELGEVEATLYWNEADGEHSACCRFPVVTADATCFHETCIRIFGGTSFSCADRLK